ncbi:MAG TPA: pilus assembly protein TadG-related protein [Candidatus Limnocylindria bacterium]
MAHAHADQGGQTVVIVAAMLVVLMGFAAMAMDVGRYYSERRHLQNAVDSAALACAYKYGSTGSQSEAWAAGNDILQKFNLPGGPTGVATGITMPPYDATGASYDYGGQPAVALNLVHGILPVSNPLGCRVAATVGVPTFFVKVVNPGLATLGLTTRAFAKSQGGFLPTVTYRYTNGPGPGTGNTNSFIDWTRQEGSDFACTSTNGTGCVDATPPGPQPVTPCPTTGPTTCGREHVLFGQNGKATNDSSFRGYIGLDIRDFQTLDPGTGQPIHQAYDGIDPTATVNILKDFEAKWIINGYAGPPLCVVDPTNFLPCAEVAAINGSSSGIFVTDYTLRYQVGDVIMLQLYDGTVKTIPDFTLQAPNITVPSGGSIPATAIVYTMNTQFQTAGSVVSTELYYDDGAVTGGPGDQSGTNPLMAGSITPCAVAPPTVGRHSCGTIALNPTPANVPTYTQAWSGMTATGAAQGIYLAWLRGNATAPYDQRQHDSLVTLTVGGQTRDFDLSGSDGAVSVAAPGIQANLAMRVRSGGGTTSWNGGPVHLTWEKCPTYIDPLTGGSQTLSCKINGSASTTSVDVPIGSGSSVEATVNVDTSAAISGRSYTGWVRGFGRDSGGNGSPVNHLFQVLVDVNVTAGGVTSYVDILGYAAFKLTAVDSNDVTGRAISKAVYDPDDPAVAMGRKIRLVPWETP